MPGGKQAPAWPLGYGPTRLKLAKSAKSLVVYLVAPGTLRALVARMGTTSKLTKEINQVLRELVGARDEARVRAHLLSMDARRRLGDLEQEIETFERKLSARGEWVAEHVIATARGLTHAIAELVGPRPEQELAHVRDVMSREPVTVQPSDNLSRAAQLMWEADCGSVPVVDGDGRLLGMLTDRDVCMAAYIRGLALHELSVSGAMSTNLHTCKAGDTLRSVMELMARQQIRRVPVVEDEGRLVGIVSLADVALLAQAPQSESREARVWVPGVLAGISERPHQSGQGGLS
jgi:CBS domain-containing protein